MVLGPGGMAAGLKSHRSEEAGFKSQRPEDRLLNNDIHVERINRQVEEQRQLKTQQPRSRRKKKRSLISANLSGTRYEIGKGIK